MKFTLEENIKHILDERFILDEDASTFSTELNKLEGILLAKSRAKESSAVADDTKNINLIRQELSTLNTTLSSFNKTSLNFLDKAINKISGQVLKSSDAAKIKGTTKEVIQKVETLLDASSIAGEKFKPEDGGVEVSVKGYLRQIKALAVSDDVSEETLLKIKENVAKIAAIINNLSKTKNDNSGLRKDNVRLAENAFISLKNLRKFISAVGGMDKFINNAEPRQQINQLITITDTIVTKYTADGTKNLKAIEKELATFNKLVRQILELSDVRVDTDGTTTIDWADRFQKANDKKSFWNAYYEKAWGTNANKIRALGDSFRNQCEKLGFDERTNPFIAFIKKYIIEKNYPIGSAVYNVIANYKKLDQDMLRGSVGNKINILSCKDLYSKQSDEIVDYLNIFNTLSTSSEVNPNTLFSINADDIEDNSRRKYFKAILSHLDHYDKSVNQIIWAILFNTISYTSLLENSGAKPIAYSETAVENTPLRKMAEIQAAIKILNPEISTISSKAYTNETLKSLLAKMPEAKESNRIKIGEWILAILGQFLLPEVQEKILASYPKLNDIKPSPLDTIKHQKQMLEFGNNMTKDQVIAILTAYENGVDDKPKTKISFK